MNQPADSGPGAAALRELVMPVDVVAASDLLLRHRRRYPGTGQLLTPPAADGYPI